MGEDDSASRNTAPGETGSFSQRLDQLIQEIVSGIERSQGQVFDIVDSIRQEMDRLTQEIDKNKEEVLAIVSEVDKLTRTERKARVRLMEVSKDFGRFTESDIKKAYEEAQILQLKLLMLRERELQARMRRDQLEISFSRLKNTMGKAEGLAAQVGVILNYLGNDLKLLGHEITDINQRQQLALGIIKAQEEERRRLAREIHDGPAQLLANAVMRTDFCLKLSDKNGPDLKKEIQAVEDMVRLSLKDLRKIIFDLRPMLLDDLGLIPAIRRHLNEFEFQSGISTEFLFFGRQKRLEPALEVALFRIIQESLNNIQKHARAEKISVKLEILVRRVNLNIKDNGQGFNAKEPTAWQAGYGLMGMRERAQLFEGEISIVSKPGEGTLVAVSIPLYEEDNDISAESLPEGQ